MLRPCEAVSITLVTGGLRVYGEYTVLTTEVDSVSLIANGDTLHMECITCGMHGLYIILGILIRSQCPMHVQDQRIYLYTNTWDSLSICMHKILSTEGKVNTFWNMGRKSEEKNEKTTKKKTRPNLNYTNKKKTKYPK